MSRLASSALAAALLVLAGCGPERSGATAEQLWEEHCARCHGADGLGTRALRGLEPKLDLSRSAMVTSRNRRRIYQRIAQGQVTMPGFAHKLPQGDIELLVEFVERFGKR
jgi:mono/diheme cytochrome c family protein